MSYQDESTYESNLPKLPPTGKGTNEDLCKLVDSKITYDAPIRQDEVSSWRYADHMDRGNQWIRKAFTHAGAGNPTQWVGIKYDPNDPKSIPTPVFNEGLGIRQNETARLGRPEYKPFVRPSGENPSIKVRLGAKKGKDVLLYQLQRMEWDKQEDLLYWHMPAYGDATVTSRWEQTWDNTTTVPIPGAVSCPRRKGAERPGPVDLAGPEGAQVAGLIPPAEEPCDFTLASPKVPREAAVGMGIVDHDPFSQEPVAAEHEAFLCPQCEDHPELVPFKASMDEAQGKDSIGRPLGQPKPLGNWVMKVESPYDVYLENGGIDIDPSNQREITLCHVESLDWVALRYPDKAAAVKPENPAKLMEYHPQAGSPEIYGAAGGAKIFGNHVRIKEYHRKPTMVFDEMSKTYAMDKGRSIILAGKVVLLDGDFLIPSLTKPGTSVDRIRWGLVPWEILEGGRLARGLSIWKILGDAQDIINTNEAMTQATNRRCAVPTYIIRRGHQATVGTLDGTPGRSIEIDTDPLAPLAVPEVFNNFTIDQGIAANSQNAVAYMQRAGGKAEVEGGSVPQGVAAATAIAQLLEQSAEHRKPRIRRVRAMLKRLWSHGLELISALWIEPRDYRYESEDGEEKWAALRGLDLEGQTDVDLEPEPISDSPDIRRESMRDLVTLGIIKPGMGDRALDRKVVKALDGDPSLFQDDDLQETAAKREWEDFIERDEAPVMDPTHNEHSVHAQEHGRAMETERFRSLEKEADWKGAFKILSGDWEQFNRSMGMMPLLLTPDKTTGSPIAIPGQLPLGAIPPPVKDLQTKLLDGWMARLQMAGWKSPNPESFLKVAIFRAHDEAHRVYGELKAMAAQPQMAAPGGGDPNAATGTGTQAVAA